MLVIIDRQNKQELNLDISEERIFEEGHQFEAYGFKQNQTFSKVNKRIRSEIEENL